MDMLGNLDFVHRLFSENTICGKCSIWVKFNELAFLFLLRMSFLPYFSIDAYFLSISFSMMLLPSTNSLLIPIDDLLIEDLRLLSYRGTKCFLIYSSCKFFTFILKKLLSTYWGSPYGFYSVIWPFISYLINALVCWLFSIKLYLYFFNIEGSSCIYPGKILLMWILSTFI